MTDFHALIANLRRPRLLIRAARLGLQDYRRERDLQRLVGAGVAADHALARLIGEEERLEEHRRAGTAAYSVARHIEILIAMISEVRLLPPRCAN